MPAHFESGYVVFRQWDKQTGLNEVSYPFQSIAEMFSLCLQTDDQLLVDRIVMEGQDTTGAERLITLVFQSTSLHDRANKQA